MSNPLLDLISQGESGAAGYNAYNRGMYKDKDGIQNFRGPDISIDFSQLTVGQIQDLQHLDPSAKDRLFAVGKYQIIPSTMTDAINKLGLDRNELFTTELQDIIFSNYLLIEKQPAVHDFITCKPEATIEAAQRGLAREWASFGDPDKGGKTHYRPPNHALITLKQSSDALNRMRMDYKAGIDRGLTPDMAWQAATNSQPFQLRSKPQQSNGILYHGAKGEPVNALQADLAALGYTDSHGRALQVDGHYGPSTEAAVRAFQDDHGLSIDGVAGKHTLRAIQGQRASMGLAPAFAPELDGHRSIQQATHLHVLAHNFPALEVGIPTHREAVLANIPPPSAATNLPPPIPDHLRDFRHASHPLHGTYVDVLDAVHAMEDDRQIPHGPESEKLAATLTYRIATTRFEDGPAHASPSLHALDKVELRGPDA